GRARLPAPRAPVHPLLSLRGLPAGRAAHAARRVGRQAEPAAPAVAAAVAGAARPARAVGGLRKVRARQRRLALGVLLGACALARTLGRWAAAELTPRAAGDLAVRLRDRLLGRPTAPLLAGVLEVACRRGLDQRAITALARTLGDALERPAFREVVGEAVDDVLARYRERMGAYPRFWMAVA